MFTGNYGAPLAQVDTRPILAAGQAWGQAFQNLGQTASDVLEKHRQKKETARNAEVLTGIIENNPEFAQSLGIKNPEEQQSLIKDFAKDPARMQMALDAVSHSQQQKMFQQRQREIDMQNLARAEENYAYTLYHTEEGTKPDPQALEQIQRLNQKLGLNPRVSMFKAQRAARSFEKADVDARLDARAKKVKTEYTEAQTDAMKESLDKAKFDKGVQKLILMKPVELRNPFAFDAGDATPEQIAAARQKVKEMDAKMASMTNDARMKRRKEISEQFDIAFKNPTIKLRQPHKEMGSTVSVEDYEKLNAKNSRKYPLDAEAYIVARNRVDELLVEQETLNRGTMVKVNIPDEDDKPVEPEPSTPTDISPPVTLDDPFTPTNVIKLGIQALPERKPYSPKYDDSLMMMGAYGGM